MNLSRRGHHFYLDLSPAEALQLIANLSQQVEQVVARKIFAKDKEGRKHYGSQAKSFPCIESDEIGKDYPVSFSTYVEQVEEA
jgi:hypothetical protein